MLSNEKVHIIYNTIIQLLQFLLCFYPVTQVIYILNKYIQVERPYYKCTDIILYNMVQNHTKQKKLW